MGDSSPEIKKMKHINDMKAFDEVFPELVELLTKDGLKDGEVADAMKWYKEVQMCLLLYFNVNFNGPTFDGFFIKSCKKLSVNYLF